MNANLPPLLNKDKVDELVGSLREKLENTDVYTRVTKRDVDMYENNFKARVHREMNGRVDHLDDRLNPRATLGERRVVMKRIHRTIRSDEVLESVASWSHNKVVLESAKCWSVLLTMDWEELNAFDRILRTGEKTQKSQALSAFLVACRSVGGLVWWLSKTPQSKKEETWVRNAAQTKATLARDGFRCVLTHSEIKEGCHVCPFWSLSRRSEIQANVIEPLGAILGERLKGKLMVLLNQKNEKGEKTAPNDFDILDSPANMITLSNQLHKMWDKGIFGLEPIRIKAENFTEGVPFAREKPATKPSAVKRSSNATRDLPPHKRIATKDGKTDKKIEWVCKERVRYGIELKFHWLRKTNLAGFEDRPPTEDADPREMWSEWVHDNVRDNMHATPLDDGYVFTIWSEDKDKLPNWELVSIQWLAFRLHRLSGAANVDLYAPQKDQDDDEALAARVLQAKREATEMIAERTGVDPDELWADPQGPYYVRPDQIPRPHDD